MGSPGISTDNNGLLLYGSYYGSTGMDAVRSIKADKDGYVYLGGFTNSVDGIATPGSHQDSYPGSVAWNAFVTRLCFEVPADRMELQGPDSVCKYTEYTFTVAAAEDATSYIWTLPQGWTGSSNTNSITVMTNIQSGTIGVQVLRCGDTSELAEFPVHVFSADPAVITFNDFVLSTGDSYESYQWLLEGEAIPGGTTASIVVSESGNYQVVTVNEQGCTDTLMVYNVTGVNSINDISLLKNRTNIYPNPVTDLLNVRIPETVEASLTTIEGKVLSSARGTHTIDMKRYAAGVYMIVLRSADGRSIMAEKVIKTK